MNQAYDAWVLDSRFGDLRNGGCGRCGKCTVRDPASGRARCTHVEWTGQPQWAAGVGGTLKRGDSVVRVPLGDHGLLSGLTHPAMFVQGLWLDVDAKTFADHLPTRSVTFLTDQMRFVAV